MAAVNSPLQSADSAENTLYFSHYFAFLETYCSQMTQDKRKHYFFPFQRIFKEEFDHIKK